VSNAKGAPAMGLLLTRLSLTFAAGTFGALVNSVALWAAGEQGLTQAIGVSLAPALTLAWLYPRLVWGGFWGALFLLPVPRSTWWVRGLVFSLAPTACALLVLFPDSRHFGLLGLAAGKLTPLVVAIANAVWGVAAAWWLRMTGQS
jgi:hypothetical protein